MKNIFTVFLDLIYKKKCYFCGSSKLSQKMCPKCYDELMFADFRPNKIIDGVDIYSCGIYEKNLQKLIRGLKYHKQKDLAFFLAKFMYEYFSKLDINKDFTVIAVPLHKNRLKKRKYNHMELVAVEFCRLCEKEYNFKLIERVKDTKPQYRLSKQERMKNLKGAFVVNIKEYNSKPVLILDDICTTGSTFEEMISTLKQAGIQDITCLSASNP